MRTILALVFSACLPTGALLAQAQPPTTLRGLEWSGYSLPPGHTPCNLAVSPDGKQVVVASATALFRLGTNGVFTQLATATALGGALCAQGSTREYFGKLSLDNTGVITFSAMKDLRTGVPTNGQSWYDSVLGKVTNGNVTYHLALEQSIKIGTQTATVRYIEADSGGTEPLSVAVLPHYGSELEVIVSSGGGNWQKVNAVPEGYFLDAFWTVRGGNNFARVFRAGTVVSLNGTVILPRENSEFGQIGDRFNLVPDVDHPFSLLVAWRGARRPPSPQFASEVGYLGPDGKVLKVFGTDTDFGKRSVFADSGQEAVQVFPIAMGGNTGIIGVRQDNQLLSQAFPSILGVWDKPSSTLKTLLLNGDNLGGSLVTSINPNVKVTGVTGDIWLIARTSAGWRVYRASKPAPPAPPAISSFVAEPASIEAGQSATLRWAVSGTVTDVRIDKGIGNVAATGTWRVTPPTTTVYRITATGPAGTATAATTVTVTPAPPTPEYTRQSIISAFYNGFNNGACLKAGLGAVMSLYGKNLAARTEVALSAPWPTSLGGTLVRINGNPAPVQLASNGQINFQIPYEVVGEAVLKVETTLPDGRVVAGPEVRVNLLSAAPCFWGTGTEAGLVSAVTGQVIRNEPLSSGDSFLMFFVGGGTTNPPVLSGASAPFPPAEVGKPAIFIGGQPAPVDFAGLVPGFVGLYQLNVRVPEGLGGLGGSPVEMEGEVQFNGSGGRFTTTFRLLVQ